MRPFLQLPLFPGAELLLIVRPNEGLFFANTAPLRERMLALAGTSDPPARAVLLDLEMSNEPGVPSADALGDLHEELAQRGITLALSRVHSQVRETLDRGDVIARIGEDRIYRRSVAAVRDFAATVSDGAAPGKG